MTTKGSELAAQEEGVGQRTSPDYLALERLTKRFGTVTAVDHVTLTIGEGEFFALLGPSGCGKTTSLRLIAGLERPTEGRILLCGRDITGLHPRERDVAMVFQDYALYPHMTLFDNIGYPLKVRGTPRKTLEARVREVADHLGISHLLSRRPAQVSGGQQQRAAVARALVHKPKVFLFDEPLSNLDAKLRLEARAFLKHLQQEVGVTAIYVTHDQAEAMAMADRIAVMDQGRLIQVGTPFQVYRQPRTTMVAGFVGNPPMNLIPCALERTSESLLLVGEGFRLDVSPLQERVPMDVPTGEELVLGVRPEHINLSDTEGPHAIRGQVYAVQPLGAETLVTLRLGGTIVSVRLFTDQPPSLTDQVWVRLDLNRLHIFRSSGDRLV
ncbi:MAG: ABC transporter ATP-binding protein [Candidatus Oleimicrobiaceae bacterium]